MDLFSLLIYLFSIGIALTTLYSCYLMYRNFQLRFLLHYLYYLSAFFLAGFIDLFGRHMAIKLLNGQEAETIMLLEHIFIFLMFPFVPLAIYFFVLFNRDFAQKNISIFLMRLYAAFWAVFFLLLVLSTKGFLSGQGAQFSQFLFAAFEMASYLAYLLILIVLLIVSIKIEDSIFRKAIQFFYLFYFFGFAITFVVSENWIGLSSESHLLTIIFYFSLNVPPLLYLRKYLKKYPPESSLFHFAPKADLEDFFSKFGLSKRETEIILLILEGKSGKDLTRELFISLHTVKNHIYHIYQKLGVKNRLQLSHLIRQHLQNQKK